MSALLREMIEFIADLARGTMTIEQAQRRAQIYQAQLAEHASDDLLDEIDRRLQELE